MAKAFQPAVNLAGHGAVSIESAVEHLAPGGTGFDKAQILQRHQFGDREAIMHLGQTDLPCRIGEPGLGGFLWT